MVGYTTRSAYPYGWRNCCLVVTLLPRCVVCGGPPLYCHRLSAGRTVRARYIAPPAFYTAIPTGDVPPCHRALVLRTVTTPCHLVVRFYYPRIYLTTVLRHDTILPPAAYRMQATFCVLLTITAPDVVGVSVRRRHYLTY